MSETAKQIDQAIAYLRKASYAIALTGAGISTPSGIPDFRSPDSGVWKTADPMEVASIYAFRHNPQAFYDWIHPLARLTAAAQPNPAHLALVEMETHGLLKGVITQNIDALHTKAGSETVYEVHGHMRRATCMLCGVRYSAEEILSDFIETGDMPICIACGGVVKPDVILFGEVLPLVVLKQAQRQVMACDLLLVAGSSLEVSPAGDLPMLAKQVGARLIFVNLTETHLDHLADVTIYADVVEVLPRLAAALVTE